MNTYEEKVAKAYQGIVNHLEFARESMQLALDAHARRYASDLVEDLDDLVTRVVQVRIDVATRHAELVRGRIGAQRDNVE